MSKELSIIVGIAAALIVLAFFWFGRRKRKSPKAKPYTSTSFIDENIYSIRPQTIRLNGDKYVPIIGSEELYRSEKDGHVVTALMLYVLVPDLERMFMNKPEDFVDDMTIEQATELSKEKIEEFEKVREVTFQFDPLHPPDLKTSYGDPGSGAYLPGFSPPKTES